MREPDIKAPDGFLLGGLRRVRPDGTILFQRDYWRAPKEWAGQDVWVHSDTAGGKTILEAAPPGRHIYDARAERTAVRLDEVDRPSAKPAFRSKVNKAWHNRLNASAT